MGWGGARWGNNVRDSLKTCTYTLIEGSLVELPAILTDGKAEVRRGTEEKGRRKKMRDEKEAEERRSRFAKR